MNIAIVFNTRLTNLIEKKDLEHFNSKVLTPFLRIIKHTKNQKFSLNLPISTLSLLEEPQRVELKDLIEHGILELTGALGFNCNSIYSSSNTLEQQILLNELSLGYYFGKHQDLEGEASLMFKDLNGFFIDNNNFSSALLNNIKSLNYKWIAGSSTDLSLETGYYHLKDLDIDIFSLSNDLNKFICSNTAEITEAENLYLNLDLSIFLEDTHNRLAKFENFIRDCVDKDARFLCLGDFYSSFDFVKIDTLETVEPEKDDILQNKFNDIEKIYLDPVSRIIFNHKEREFLEINPYWEPDILDKLNDNNLKQLLAKNLLAHKIISAKNLMELEDSLKKLEI